MFNRRVFKLNRPTKTNGDKTAYQDSGEELVGNLEPIDIEVGALGGGSFGQTYKLFSKSTASSVKIGDRLTDLGTDESYEVRGVQNFNHPPRHLELIIEKQIKQ